MNKITFVTCIESGFMEEQVVRLVESMRKYGGTFANAPFYVVIPRFNLPLASSTKRKLQQYNAQLIRIGGDKRYSWFKFFNKPHAISALEKIAVTPQLCWLDGDIIIIKEPAELELKDKEDFAAFPVQIKEMGTTGLPDDPYLPLWKSFCRTLNLELDQLPKITCEDTEDQVHLYYNSGVFVYKTNTQFGQHYLDITRKLLDSKSIIDDPNYSHGVKEMAAIGFAVIKERLRARSLSSTHNYSIGSTDYTGKPEQQNKLRAAAILHYHDAMWPAFWNNFLTIVQNANPNAAKWLNSIGPMTNQAPLPYRIINRYINKYRNHCEKKYSQTCRETLKTTTRSSK